jgi:hypothetical protein
MVTGLIASEGAGASIISIGLMLNAPVSADQTVVTIAASVRHIGRHMPIAIGSVVRAMVPAIRCVLDPKTCTKQRTIGYSPLQI